ncbi:MAG: leucine-rich repeat protein [Clostridia bacterium]|nr:leucine-rich repeat protein [Clostridia bacterium]
MTSIGNHASYWCDAMTWIVLPKSVTSIGDYAFYGCDGLTICAPRYSYAITYAREHNIPFKYAQ